jgi:hypothetical protein
MKAECLTGSAGDLFTGKCLSWGTSTIAVCVHLGNGFREDTISLISISPISLIGREMRLPQDWQGTEIKWSEVTSLFPANPHDTHLRQISQLFFRCRWIHETKGILSFCWIVQNRFARIWNSSSSEETRNPINRHGFDVCTAYQNVFRGFAIR